MGLTLQAGGARPARATVALPMYRVTGGPIEAGAGLAAVVPIGEGWAGCRREGGQASGEMDSGKGGSRSGVPGALWSLYPSLWPGRPSEWPQIGINMLPRGQSTVPRVASWQLRSARTRPRSVSSTVNQPPPQHPGLTGPHALWAQRGPRRPAGQRQVPLTASQGVPAVQSQARWQSSPKKPAGQAAGGGR